MFENDAASDLWGNLRLASSVLVPGVYLHVGGGAGEQHVAVCLLHPPPPPRCVTPPRLYAQFVGAAPPKDKVETNRCLPSPGLTSLF